jgi:hypothetical protein
MVDETDRDAVGKSALRGQPDDATARNFDDWKTTRATRANPAQITASDYDSRPQEDQARRNIAYALIGLLWFLCVASFVTTWFTKPSIEDVLKVVQILISPVIALVSAATGFYYATKTRP